MNSFCKYTLTLMLLAFESVAEAVLYNNTSNIKAWMISLLSIVNYATVWFCITITSKHALDVTNPTVDESDIKESIFNTHSADNSEYSTNSDESTATFDNKEAVL